MERGSAEGVLITGVYGSGKSAVAEEISHLLEERGLAYAALDLDWLGWFDAGWDDEWAEYRVLLENLEAIVANYLRIGIPRFVLALSIESAQELADIRAVLPMPLRVVRLTVDLETIKERLRADVTSGRRDDLEWAGVQLSKGAGEGLEDFVLANDGSIREVASEIVDRLGWGT